MRSHGHHCFVRPQLDRGRRRQRRVGKTTVSAAAARLAARHGGSALLVELKGKSGLNAAFGHHLWTCDEIELSGAGSGAADLIVVDGPATTFFISAQGLLDASRAGPSALRLQTWWSRRPTRPDARSSWSPWRTKPRSTRRERRRSPSKTGSAPTSARSS